MFSIFRALHNQSTVISRTLEFVGFFVRLSPICVELIVIVSTSLSLTSIIETVAEHFADFAGIAQNP